MLSQAPLLQRWFMALINRSRLKASPKSKTPRKSSNESCGVLLSKPASIMANTIRPKSSVRCTCQLCNTTGANKPYRSMANSRRPMHICCPEIWRSASDDSNPCDLSTVRDNPSCTNRYAVVGYGPALAATCFKSISTLDGWFGCWVCSVDTVLFYLSVE